VALERAVKLDPSLVVAREELADLDRELGLTSDELAQLESLTGLDPRPSRYVALGLAYARAGRNNQAIRALGVAAERFPEHPGIYAALGRVWLENAQNGQDRIALSKALEALQAVPPDAEEGPEARMLYGRALLMTGDRDLAEKVLEDAVTHHPVDPQAFLYLADAAEGLGHLVAARRALLKYQALEGDASPASAQAQRATRLADLSLKVGDPAAAVVWLKQAVELSPPSASLLGRLGEAQLAAGDTDAARDSVRRALELEPDNRTAVALARKIR
jgi:tetratricopeptide (TPR) repeat protein